LSVNKEKAGKSPIGHTPDVEIVYDPSDRDPSERYVDGIDLWFLMPSDPVAQALYSFCVEREIHWHIAVRRFLKQGLTREGCLEKSQTV